MEKRIERYGGIEEERINSFLIWANLNTLIFCHCPLKGGRHHKYKSTPHKSGKIMKFWIPLYWQWVPHSTCFYNVSQLNSYWSDASYYLLNFAWIRNRNPSLTMSWYEGIQERSVFPVSERKQANSSMELFRKDGAGSKKWATWETSHLTCELMT